MTKREVAIRERSGERLSETSHVLSEQIRLRQRADRRSRYQRREMRTAFDGGGTRRGSDHQGRMSQCDFRQSKKLATSEQVGTFHGSGLNSPTTQTVERSQIVWTYRIVTRISLVFAYNRFGLTAVIAAAVRFDTGNRACTSAFPTIEERTGHHLCQHKQSDKYASGH